MGGCRYISKEYGQMEERLMVMFNSLEQYPSQFSLSWIQQCLQVLPCQLTLEVTRVKQP